MFLNSPFEDIHIRFANFIGNIINRVGIYAAFAVSASSILFLLLFLNSSASSANTEARVIVVAVDHLSINDLASAGPSIKAMTANGSVGLMNTGLYKDDALTFRYLSMASGSRPVSRIVVQPEFCNSRMIIGKSSAGDVFAFNTGRKASDESVVCLNYQKIVHEYGTDSSYNTIDAGLIGDLFHQNGMKTAVIGNSGGFDKSFSYAPLIAADSFGYIDAGDIGSGCLKIQPDNPSGIVDDIDKILQDASRYTSKCSLVLIQTGDLSRLERYRSKLSDVAYQSGRNQALKQLDHIIGGLLPIADKYNASLMLISSCRNSIKGGLYSNLAPVVIYHKGKSQSLMTSATTHTKGLISNIDIAPSILSIAEISCPVSILGQPLGSIPASNSVEYLCRFDKLASDSFSFEVPAFIILGIVLILVVTVCEFALRIRNITRKALKRIFILGTGVISVPASLLIVDWVRAENLFQYFFRLLFALMFVMLAAYILTRMISRWIHDFNRVYPALILTVTSLMFMIDIITGGRPFRWSILNCDYITGIRYYGIGNEYMGLFIGSALMAPLILLMKSHIDDTKRVFASSRLIICITAFWFTTAAILIGFPELGANVGGLLTAIAVFSAALVVISGIRITYRHGAIMLIIAIIAIIVFAAIDMYNTTSVSHLGRSISIAENSGIISLMELIFRKIVMHIGIITSPAAYCPILFGMPFVLMYARRLKNQSVKMSVSNYMNASILPVIIIGVLVAFLFNDSGVVPASLFLGFYMASSIVLRLGEKTCE